MDSENKMSLGEILSATHENKRRQEEEKLAQDARQEAKRQELHRNLCMTWFYGCSEGIEEIIIDGGIPRPIRLPDFISLSAGYSDIRNAKHGNHWLLQEYLMPWAQKSGLLLKISETDDGFGRSVYELSVTPA